MPDLRIDPSLTLPRGFQFSQSKLQDFEDCARRFYLKYILNQPWPSPLSEPQETFEQSMVQGKRFHRLAERHQLGIALDVLQQSAAHESELADWLRHYQQLLDKLGPFDRVWPEVSLSTFVGKYPLLAKFDLIGLQGRNVIAVDWKTGRLPDNSRLERRMQTVVYLYVLQKEAARLVGSEIDTFTLTYASVVAGELRSFRLDAENLAKYERRIQSIIGAIEDAIQQGRFDKVEDSRPCRFCFYRGLCERGTSPTATPAELDMDDFWPLEPGEEGIEQYTVEF